MKNYNIVVLKGDGIGPEIVDEALKVLDATGEEKPAKQEEVVTEQKLDLNSVMIIS